MTLKLIAERLQLSALTPALPLDDLAEVRAAHASDLLSDVLANARAGACCSRSRCI